MKTSCERRLVCWWIEWPGESEKLGRFSVGHTVAPHALSDHGLASRESQTGKQKGLAKACASQLITPATDARTDWTNETSVSSLGPPLAGIKVASKGFSVERCTRVLIIQNNSQSTSNSRVSELW